MKTKKNSKLKMSYLLQTNMSQHVYFQKKHFYKKKKTYIKYFKDFKTTIQEKKDFFFEKGSFFKKKLLVLKQIRFFYGNLSLASFKKIVFLVSKFEGNKNKNLLCYLELRLQTFVFRINFSKTIFEAQNLIRSKTFFVNSSFVTSPGYLMAFGDVVSFSVFKKHHYFGFFFKKKESFFFKHVNYAITDYSVGLSVVCSLPSIQDMQFPFYFVTKYAFEYLLL